MAKPDGLVNPSCNRRQAAGVAVKLVMLVLVVCSIHRCNSLSLVPYDATYVWCFQRDAFACNPP